MIKACEWRNCCNFFSVGEGRRKKFCQRLCGKRASNLKWSHNNVDEVNKAQREYKRKMYNGDEEYRQNRLDYNKRLYDSRDDEAKDRTRTSTRRYQRRLRAENLHYKIRMTLTSRIKVAVKAATTDKCYKTMDLLGCTIDHVRQHLEAQFTDGMTWDNHGEWHIDHIKPCASFDLTDADQQRECFNYTNLQPLWAKDNLAKGAKIL